VRALVGARAAEICRQMAERMPFAGDVKFRMRLMKLESVRNKIALSTHVHFLKAGWRYVQRPDYLCDS
jgi:hypothetical protein